MLAVIYFGGLDTVVMNFLNDNRGLYLSCLLLATLQAILSRKLGTKDR